MTATEAQAQEPAWRGLDGVYLAMALVLAAMGLGGAYLVDDPFARWSLALVGILGLLLPIPHRFLRYRLTDDAFIIRTLFRTHVVPVAQVTRARLVRLRWRSFREFGASLPGYHVGSYRMHGLGPVWTACTRLSGTGLLLERTEGLPLLVTPRNPMYFLQKVQACGVVVGEPTL